MFCWICCQISIVTSHVFHQWSIRANSDHYSHLIFVLWDFEKWGRTNGRTDTSCEIVITTGHDLSIEDQCCKFTAEVTASGLITHRFLFIFFFRKGSRWNVCLRFTGGDLGNAWISKSLASTVFLTSATASDLPTSVKKETPWLSNPQRLFFNKLKGEVGAAIMPVKVNIELQIWYINLDSLLPA